MRIPNLEVGEKIGLNDEGGAEYEYRVLHVIKGDEHGDVGLYALEPLNGGKADNIQFHEWREAVLNHRGRPIPTIL